MPTYLVSIVDATTTMPVADKDRVRQLLQTWFSTAAAVRSDSMAANVAWTSAPGTDAALVIYFVLDYRHSIMGAIPRYHASSDLRRAGGLTALQNGEGNYRTGSIHGSEVYLDKWETAEDKAMAAFHEAMHNQLRIGNLMHFNPQDYGGGVAAEFPPNGTVPNQANLRNVGNVMDLRHSQLLNGLTFRRQHN